MLMNMYILAQSLFFLLLLYLLYSELSCVGFRLSVGSLISHFMHLTRSFPDSYLLFSCFYAYFFQ